MVKSVSSNDFQMMEKAMARAMAMRVDASLGFGMVWYGMVWYGIMDDITFLALKSSPLVAADCGGLSE